MRTIKFSYLLFFTLFLCGVSGFAGPDLKAVFKTSDLRGVLLHVGSGDGNLTADLWQKQGLVIQYVDTDAAAVEQTRNAALKADLYGKVTARKINGKELPFIDNSINYLIVTGAADIPQSEILRVLAPKGQVWLNGKVAEKPWPEGMDGWGHFHYDATGSMVGKDRLVGPPRRFQWIGAPKWLRNHEYMASMHAMVTSNGRVFYVIDEGKRNHILMPAKWALVARDAFNGTVLWKKYLKDWHPHNWPLKSGPGDYPRRLVAVGDRVYFVPGMVASAVELDAGTGKVLQTYKGSDGAAEILHADGTLYVLADPGRGPVEHSLKETTYKEIKNASKGKYAWTDDKPARKILAFDAGSGKQLWQHEAKVAPVSLTVGPDRVFFAGDKGVVALTRSSGKKAWSSDGPELTMVETGGKLRMVVSKGTLLYAQGSKLSTFDAKNGKLLWSGKLQGTGHNCSDDLFVVGDLVWSPKTGKEQETGTPLKAFDLKSGDLKEDFRAQNLKGFPMHPRCYPGKATERFLIMQGMGAEFYEIGKEPATVDINHFVRGSCIYGLMPANGLLYKPADNCACYYQSKLEHMAALAPASDAKPRIVPETARLTKGAAYGKCKAGKSEWPMYRADPARSGSTASKISSGLKPGWSVKLGGRLTQPVIADGCAFVAAMDKHTLYALDQSTGTIKWFFTAGGRIDSAPTYYNGALIFGAADGWVYSLRAVDGVLAWKYMVAPEDKQMFNYQQAESVWPVSGSVLVHNNIAYCLAGRSMYMDGGLKLVMLNAATGEKKGERSYDEKNPETGEPLLGQIHHKMMPVTNPDLFSTDGKKLYMQAQQFDMTGKRLFTDPLFPDVDDLGGDSSHLFCQTGFLDAMWFHRSFWLFAERCGEGWKHYSGVQSKVPTGRLMVFDKTKVYAFKGLGIKNNLQARTTYKLYSANKRDSMDQKASSESSGGKKKKKEKKPKGSERFLLHWENQEPAIKINGMALADSHLVVAGPPDLADETKMFAYIPGKDDAINKEINDQNDAWDGKHGGVLQVVSKQDGKKVAEYKLPSYPVFDGLSIAENRVFMSMIDGTVQCFRGQ